MNQRNWQIILDQKRTSKEEWKATYTRVDIDKRPEKGEVSQTRIPTGGDWLEWKGNTSARTAELEQQKWYSIALLAH